MNKILTDEEIFKLQYELQYREGGFHPIPFAKAIEQAILNRLSEQEPIAWLQTSVEYGVDTVIARTYKPDKFNAKWWRFDPLYLHPAPSVPTQVTCQLYGHVVGACDECNTHTEKDVNETNKRLADNYLKLTCGIAPSVPEWQPIETAPMLKTVLLAVEFDGPGDWRIKCGSFYSNEWHVFGASWKPTHWMPLPKPPVSARRK